MTVITKPLSEKKCDKTEEPLVDEVKFTILDGSRRIAEDGGSPPPLPNALERRVSSATTACLFLTALLVMSCGIISGVCLYQQFSKTQVQRFLCSIPFGKDGMEMGRPMASSFQGDNFYEMTKNGLAAESGYLTEEVEINQDYEKISVPDLNSANKRSRFIHDFKINKTCIIDLDARRCFVMPLNRSVVLPPTGFLDIIEKMREGYYDVDTTVVRQTMRVVTPPMENRASLGVYIQRECFGFPIYRLEKYDSPVFKRSLTVGADFVEFAGKKTHQLHIINYGDLDEHESLRPVAMA